MVRPVAVPRCYDVDSHRYQFRQDIGKEGGGERGRNRTFNLLIKSQLLCQLSYAPTAWGWREVRTKIIASDFAEVGAHIVNELAHKSYLNAQ